MKKSLLMILGAALLTVGCSKELETKVDDLSSKLDKIEAQVEANKKAIEELRNAKFISKVEAVTGGWEVTLSDGSKLVLYNGKDGQNGQDGQNGDSFFQSVVVDGDVVVITLVDGTVINVPYVAEFALVLDTGVVAHPSETIRVGYEVVGKTAETTVNVIASGNYFADIEGDDVVITCPETITPGRLLVYADNGHGKTSIKTVDIDSQKVEVGDASSAIFFWGGSCTFDVASNVDVTVEVAAEDKGWLTVERTKGVKTSTYTAKAPASPFMDVRKGHITVKDPAGVVIKTVEIAQTGTGKPIYIEKVNKQFATFAEAVAYGEDSMPDDGTVRLSISQSLLTPYTTEDICVIPATTKKNWVITARTASGIDGQKCIFGGLNVQGKVYVNCFNVGIRPTGKVNYQGVQFNNYPYGVVVGSGVTAAGHVTVSNTTLYATDEFKAASGTLIAVDANSSAIVALNNLHGDANGVRYAQIYGGDVTFTGCEIRNSYSSYAVRVGREGTKCKLTGNVVDNGTFVDLHTSLKDATVTFGDGNADDNSYSKNVTLIAKGTPDATVTVAPASVLNAAPAPATVHIGEYGFGTIQAAVNAANAGDVIEIGAGEYKEVVRVANGKSVILKGADQTTTILAGGIEISGSANISNLTIKSKAGVTTNTLTVTVSGEAYLWGHHFLARVENGAHDVVFDKVCIDATDNTDDNFKNSMSMLWISQAKNIVVKNSTFNTAADASYCPNQTHAADVLFENNVFNGGGKKGWAIRAMDTDVLVVRGNEFHSTYAIDVYNSGTDVFKGSLTLGDGSTDDNIYGDEVVYAICGEKETSVNAGAVFAPEDVLFNSHSTTEGACYEKLWSLNMTESGIPQSRNFTFDGTNVICGCCPKPWWTPAEMVAVRGGQVVATLAWNKEWVNGFTGAITGLTTVKDNGQTCVLACNVASEGNQWAATNSEFNVYKYTGLDKVEKVVSLKRESADNTRLGDYLSFAGTWQDGAILVCEANNKGPRVYEFVVKDGKVSNTPNILTFAEEARLLKNGMAGIFHYKDDIYVLTNEGAAPIVVKRQGTEFSLVGDGAIDLTVFNGGKTLRTPKFVTLNGKEYMIGLIGTYDNSKWVGTASVVAIPIEGDLVASLKAATKENTQYIDVQNSATGAGNGFAGLDIIQKGGSVYIGYGLMDGELGLIKFRAE